jgi:hypothetical protein
VDRYRTSAPIGTSASVGRGMTSSAAPYGYYPETTPSYSSSMSGAGLQYQTEFGSDQRHQQGFTAYNPHMLYNVNQPTSQGTVYDPGPQYQQRQPAGLQLLTEVAAPYYGSEASNTGGASLMPQHPSSSSLATYQQSQVERSSLLTGYAGSVPGMGGMVQGHPDVMDEEDYTSNTLNEDFNSYQNALKQIFLNVRNSQLAEAAESLLQTSEWFLSHVGELGKLLLERESPTSNTLCRPHDR